VVIGNIFYLNDRAAVAGVPFYHYLSWPQATIIIIATMSESTSTSAPSVTVTLDELARAIDNMGLTPTVSARLLYHVILQVQVPPTTPQPPITAQQNVLHQRKSNSCQYLIITFPHMYL
jgi:hypothetical protein